MIVTGNLYAFLWNDLRRNNCNAYLIDGSKRILIDPGFGEFMARLKTEPGGLSLPLESIDAALITHGHPDHFDGVNGLPKTTVFAIAEDDYQMVRNAMGPSALAPEPAFFLVEGDLAIGDTELRIISTPGHSPASVSIYWPARKALFTGDVIFCQSIGRTDLFGGNGKLLKESIKRLAALDVEYLLPGHGEIIRGAEAVRQNFSFIESSWFDYLR
ncbi:MAG: MBL fold metallo-hydrolase [Deltaproteobacteria bacterium]|nr:MBL fold metallo-hydrolase [Deltaproteobacteria bacterium]